MRVCAVAQSSPTLCNPMDWSPLGSSDNGTVQAILEQASPGRGHSGKESACNAGDVDLTPGLGGSPRGGNGSLL